MQSADGKYYMQDVLNTKGILRLVQSIPSPKAEPFKLWLAQVGGDRLDEIADPEKAMQRGADFLSCQRLFARMDNAKTSFN